MSSSKGINLSSHRSSHEVVLTFPARRFTDTSVKQHISKTTEAEFRAPKSSYFKGFLSKEKPTSTMPTTNINGSKGAEESSFRVSKPGNKVLDALFLSRKNAMVVMQGEKFLSSPMGAVGGSYKHDNSPTNNRMSHKKMSQGQTSANNESKPKDLLKMKVLELEKRLKNFEKTSRSYKVGDLSGDHIQRKPSAKVIGLNKTPSPLLTIVPATVLANRCSPKHIESTSGDILSRRGWNPTPTNSKYENSYKDNTVTTNKLSREHSNPIQSTQVEEEDRSQLIEYELTRLKDRITKAFIHDDRVLQALCKIAGGALAP